MDVSKHTKGTWNRSGQLIQNRIGIEIAHVFPGNSSDPYEAIHNANILTLTPTAPHICDDPACPGDVNRKKLELFDGISKALQSCLSEMKAMHGQYCPDCEGSCPYEKARCEAYIAVIQIGELST